MDDAPDAPADLWIWQGFAALAAVTAAQKPIAEALMGAFPPPIGAVMPPPGLPPMAWSADGTQTMFGVQTRIGAPMACPEGMVEADRALVARLIAG